MKITYNDSSIDIELDTSHIDDGESFKKNIVPVSIKKTNNEYKKLSQDTINIKIPREVLKEMVRVWHISFNDFDELEVVKLMGEMLSMGSVVEELFINKDYYVEIESKLSKEYNSISSKNIEFTFKGEFGQSEYYLIIRPTGPFSAQAILVPKESWNNISKDKKEQDFFILINIPLDRAPSSSITEDNVLLDKAETTLEIPYSSLSTQEHTERGIIKSEMILYRITDLGRKSLDWYKSINKFIGESLFDNANNGPNPSYYTSKVAFVSNVIQVDKITNKSIADVSTGSLFYKRETKFIYSEIFFPIPVYLSSNSLISFTVCSDSDKRNIYGPFSKGVIKEDTNKDEPLFSDYNAFFVFDYDNNVKTDPVSENELPWPEF